MPYLHLDLPGTYPVEVKRELATRLCKLYAEVMETQQNEQNQSRRANASELLDLAMRAHGGRERWRPVQSLDVRVSTTGGLFRLKGYSEGMPDVNLKIDASPSSRPITVRTARVRSNLRPDSDHRCCCRVTKAGVGEQLGCPAILYETAQVPFVDISTGEKNGKPTSTQSVDCCIHAAGFWPRWQL
jgi:hypothetical protein